MPSISYRDLLSGQATTEVVFNGHTLVLTYDPSSITDSAYRDIRQLAAQALSVTATPAATPAATPTATPATDDATAAAPTDATQQATQQATQATQVNQAIATLDEVLGLAGVVNALLCRFLRAWDLTDDDGVTMFPITPERLGDLPLPFRQACLAALLSAGQMGEASGTTPSAR